MESIESSGRSNKVNDGIEKNLKKHFYSLTIQNINEINNGKMPDNQSFNSLYAKA